MENYQEYKSKLFEAFMDAEYPQKEVEYEEVEVEPVFLISEEEELTEENTAIIIEDEELSEELLNELKGNQKYADFKGHQVIVDKNSGVIVKGKFKGKRVNLVKDRQINLKKVYKQVNKPTDEYIKNDDLDSHLNIRKDKFLNYRDRNTFHETEDDLDNAKKIYRRNLKTLGTKLKDLQKDTRDTVKEKIKQMDSSGEFNKEYSKRKEYKNRFSDKSLNNKIAHHERSAEIKRKFGKPYKNI